MVELGQFCHMRSLQNLSGVTINEHLRRQNNASVNLTGNSAKRVENEARQRALGLRAIPAHKLGACSSRRRGKVWIEAQKAEICYISGKLEGSYCWNKLEHDFKLILWYMREVLLSMPSRLPQIDYSPKHLSTSHAQLLLPHSRVKQRLTTGVSSSSAKHALTAFVGGTSRGELIQLPSTQALSN